MPQPTAATFDRLRALAAIEQPDNVATRPVLEAYSGEAMTTIYVGTEKDVELAFTRARVAQRDWAARPISERAAILRRFAKLVHTNQNALKDVVQAETGKARAYAQEEVLDVEMTATWYARHGAKLLKRRRAPGMLPVLTHTRVNYQPKGVVGVISPWNYPITLAVSDAIPALLAGNAVVVKPDSQTPFCALAAAELLYEAGLPKDLFAVVPGPGSVVGTAIADSADYLMFTGSSATGAKLAEKAGKRLIGFSAELGGKNPLIVTNDADIAFTAKGAARGAFSNSGQLCISIERIYVERGVADAFTTAFAAETKAMNLAGTYDFTADMGSLASQAQIDTVAAHVEDAVSKGATVLAGGKKRPDLGPFFFEPTVLTGVTEDMLCYRSETFGPVVSVYPVDSIDEAVQQANDTEYGLNAAVFTTNAKSGREIAERIHAGTVNINEGYGAAWGSTAAPMGGMGASGLGRRHGAEGIIKYTESQTVAHQRGIALSGIKGIPRSLFLRVMPVAVRVIGYLPR